MPGSPARRTTRRLPAADVSSAARSAASCAPRPTKGWRGSAGAVAAGAPTAWDHRRDEAIAAPVQSLDDLPAAARVADGAPRGRDAPRQHGLAHHLAGPERVEQLLLRHHAGPATQEEREHVEDLGLQLDRAPAPPEGVQVLVEFEIPEREDHGAELTAAGPWRHGALRAWSGGREDKLQRPFPTRAWGPTADRDGRTSLETTWLADPPFRLTVRKSPR